MLRRTEAVVLSSRPYGEADLLVTFLTRDLGLAKGFAKSPRKLKSRFGSSLEPLTHSVISLWGREDAALPRLTQSDIISSHQVLRESYHTFLRASEAAELAVRLLPERKPAPRAFALLRETLDLMEGEGGTLAGVLFKLRILGIAGFAPRLRGCARCGGEAVRFSASQGSVVCDPCSGRMGIDPRERLVLSPGAVRVAEALLTWEMGKTSRLRPSKELLDELSQTVDAHIEYTLSRRLATRAFAPA
jgi:DNA repair protein RecO (recombination protein O)